MLNIKRQFWVAEAALLIEFAQKYSDFRAFAHIAERFLFFYFPPAIYWASLGYRKKQFRCVL
jgi:hypothetical protein